MILAIIQARMGSTRLPKKVMMDLAGRPVLRHVIDRLSHASRIDEIIVATTHDRSDDCVEEQCRDWDVPVFRGPVDDVLARFHGAVRSIPATRGPVEAIVRITADCPLLDPRGVDRVVDEQIAGQYDYVSNVDPPTWPDGLDVEVFTNAALDEAFARATLPSEREHVTPYIRNNPRFRKSNVIHVPDLSKIRLTLDTEKDFLLIGRIYQALYRPGGIFFLEDVLRLLEREPSLMAINAVHERNEGYRKSLEQDPAR